MTSAPTANDVLLIGTLGQAFGIKGQIKLITVTSRPEHLRRVKTIFVGPKLKPYQLKLTVPHKHNIVIFTLEGVDDRTAAEALQGAEVFIRTADAAPLEAEEYFYHDLPGLTVQTVAGEVLGAVKEVLETGANDVLVVIAADGRELLIPMIKAVVKNLDLAARTLTIDPLPGLLD